MLLVLISTVAAQCSCGYFPEVTVFGGNAEHVPSMGLAASVSTIKGVAVGGPVYPNAPGNHLRLVGRRHDAWPQVTVESEVWIDGGSLLEVRLPHPCGSQALPAFGVTTDYVYFGASATPQCAGNGDLLVGSLVDASGYSGHVALRTASGYLTIAGELGRNDWAVLPDGGMPNPADFPAGWVRTREDGGTYFPYAGLHGNVTAFAITPMYAGQLQEWKNPIGDGFTDHRAGIDYNGGYWQNHGLYLEQFPSPVAATTLTSVGQYRFMMPGTLYWAVDKRRWYYTNGDVWVQLATRPELDALAVTTNARLEAIEARLAALEAHHP